MAAPCIAPQVEPPVEKETCEVCETGPVAPEQPPRSILAEIFEGHEDFLGWTPD
jgi:hypothetical protein